MARRRRRRRRRGDSGQAPIGTPEEQLREEYAYVIRDLRWVFILAAIMFALLITLNLLLQ